MTEHTPTPWTVNWHSHMSGELWLSIGYLLPDGTARGPILDMAGENTQRYQPVGELKWLATPDEEQIANAEHIVRAVNAHDELVAALEMELEYHDGDAGVFWNKYGDLTRADRVHIIRHALEKARGSTS